MQSVSAGYLTAINARARTIAHQVKITFVDNSILGSLITITADEGDASPAPKSSVADGYDAINEQYALADPFDETDPSDRERMYPADDLYPLPDGIIWFGDTLSDNAGAVKRPNRFENFYLFIADRIC